MVRGWQRVVLMIVMAGVLVALASPSIPDPLSIPGRNVVVFAMVFLAMSFLHAFVLERPCFVALYEVEGRSAPDRLALICSRLC